MLCISCARACLQVRGQSHLVRAFHHEAIVLISRHARPPVCRQCIGQLIEIHLYIYMTITRTHKHVEDKHTLTSAFHYKHQSHLKLLQETTLHLPSGKHNSIPSHRQPSFCACREYAKARTPWSNSPHSVSDHSKESVLPCTLSRSKRVLPLDCIDKRMLLCLGGVGMK